MASLNFVRHLIECDGCQVVFGDRTGFASITEAKAVAYSEGWRFPSQLTRYGKASASTSDVCPKCIESWQPQTRELAGRNAGARRLSTVEADLLPDEAAAGEGRRTADGHRL